MAGRMLNAKALKNIGIITEVISPHAKFPKDIILNIRIPLKYFPIFSKPYPLKEVVECLEKFHVYALLATYEDTSQKKKKRKTAKNYSERMSNKLNVSRENIILLLNNQEPMKPLLLELLLEQILLLKLVVLLLFIVHPFQQPHLFHPSPSHIPLYKVSPSLQPLFLTMFLMLWNQVFQLPNPQIQISPFHHPYHLFLKF